MARSFRLQLRALGGLLPCVLACEVDLNRMLDQRKFEAYEANAFFDDGRSMRRPPAGTVHREAPAGPASLLSGMDGTRYLDRIPILMDARALERGQRAFRIYCQVCHGELGDGQSQVAENMKLRKPPSLHEARIGAYPPGRLYRVISEGYGLMPSYAEELNVEERWAVVAFVGALQLSRNVQLAELPPAVQAEAQAWLR
jgi:mono/diheme cytochrome c family protein